MHTLSLRIVICNPAAVFSKTYGAVARQAQRARCSRQTVYNNARQVELRLQPQAPPALLPKPPVPTPTPSLDGPTRRRLAVTAFALGISTRQIEQLFRILLADEAPDHSTIGRWIALEAGKAKQVLQALDAACVPEVRTLALDEIFFGGDRPWSPSSRRA